MRIHIGEKQIERFLITQLHKLIGYKIAFYFFKTFIYKGYNWNGIITFECVVSIAILKH